MTSHRSTARPATARPAFALVRNMVVVPLVLGLAACGGGGGGGVNTLPAPPVQPPPDNTTPPDTTPPDTTPPGGSHPDGPGPGETGNTGLPDIPAPPDDAAPDTDMSGTVTLPSQTREGTIAITAEGEAPASGYADSGEGSGTLAYTLDGDGLITSLTATGAHSSASFDVSAGGNTELIGLLPTTDLAEPGIVLATNGRSDILVLPSNDTGFEYQTFGVWATNIVPEETATYGAFTAAFDDTTPTVPTTGSATFSGYAMGIYSGDETLGYIANTRFDVDFTGRTVAFTTSDERLGPLNGNTTRPAEGLSISGTMTYANGAATFSGPLAATGKAAPAQLTGTGSGRFYGPVANELGGTFFLKSATEGLVGAFGAQQ